MYFCNFEYKTLKLSKKISLDNNCAVINTKMLQSSLASPLI